MRDGQRRVTQITEVVGMEGDVITTQDLFTYRYEGESADGRAARLVRVLAAYGRLFYREPSITGSTEP